MRSTSLLTVVGNVQLESLTISKDAMPHHYVARAVIFDLQPSQVVAAIVAVDDTLKVTYPLARRTGWRAASDGIYVHFYAWTCPPAQHATAAATAA